MDEKLRILLCEDDENLGMLLREYLQASIHVVVEGLFTAHQFILMCQVDLMEDRKSTRLNSSHAT